MSVNFYFKERAYLFKITIRNRKLFLRMCNKNLIYI